jgi:hypothetical protein
MPGVKTTLIDKNSGTAEIRENKPGENSNAREQAGSAYFPPPRAPDEIPKLKEWFACYKNGILIERFVSEIRAQEYCDRGLSDRWEKEAIKS